ncbi:putative Fe-S cluster assembly protein SufT [Coxiella endosymbiont of Amblyomma sculptum]|uniref:putative Fe-S cluster assembly protein SufT n=1 Tax=Coxiella endosymbiont of Amblyomma sculptum TaxID=2487929 RepID=UPI00132E92BB|nr:putative Fe-S cluster assembly protein SufT [Coxiella endosymbiont of Amblyomma sculptum]QHG92532.1 putative Fe-S cluster assembly protein SufT [Coxiella endosymbiont of Amblyomma sculptum]
MTIRKHEKKSVILKRDTLVTLIPSGVSTKILRGSAVTVVQNLGDTFTIRFSGRLARIESKDADALGKSVRNALQCFVSDASVKEKVWSQLSTVFDPEIPVNIVELGLIYTCDVECLKNDDFHVVIAMTLTAPGCGMGPILVEDVKRKVLAIPQVNVVKVDLVFDPPWSREMMSDSAKLQLGVFY